MTEPWFTTGEAPALIGRRCEKCGTYAFPPTISWCPNPGCDGTELASVELSRQGRVWSYTTAEYQPPLPYQPPRGEHRPFAIAAVQLEVEAMVVLGQVAEGYGIQDLSVGAPVELVVEPLDDERMVWKWRPVR